jgi:glycosyltransferase involved in cell wall biosynthesis
MTLVPDVARVALITSRFPFGAKESFLREEIVEISRSCELLVLPALPTREGETFADVSARRLRLLSWHVLAAAALESVRAPLAVLRVMATVVSAPRELRDKCKNLLIFPTALAAARIVRQQRIKHVHAYWLAIPATVAYVAATLNDIAWSATGHRYDLVGFNLGETNPRRSTFISSAQFIRTISRQGEERVRRALGRNTPRVFTEHLGVRLPQTASHAVPNPVFRLLCAANLERVKGHATLLEALARVVDRGIDVSCTIAGDGTLRQMLEAQAQALGLSERVHFAGLVPHDRLLAAIQAGVYDAAILTSIDEGPAECEGIPVFLIESMAAGLAVIATRSGAVSELVDGTNGLLCAPDDRDAVATAIADLATRPALRAKLGAAGRATVEARFDVRENAARIASLILSEVLA